METLLNAAVTLWVICFFGALVAGMVGSARVKAIADAIVGASVVLLLIAGAVLFVFILWL